MSDTELQDRLLVCDKCGAQKVIGECTLHEMSTNVGRMCGVTRFSGEGINEKYLICDGRWREAVKIDDNMSDKIPESAVTGEPIAPTYGWNAVPRIPKIDEVRPVRACESDAVRLGMALATLRHILVDLNRITDEGASAGVMREGLTRLRGQTRADLRRLYLLSADSYGDTAELSRAIDDALL